MKSFQLHRLHSAKRDTSTVDLFCCAILWNSLRNAAVAVPSIANACNTGMVGLCLFAHYFLAAVIRICYVVIGLRK